MITVSSGGATNLAVEWWIITVTVRRYQIAEFHLYNWNVMCFIVYDLTFGFECNLEDQRWIVTILVFNSAIILADTLHDVSQSLQANGEIAT